MIPKSSTTEYRSWHSMKNRCRNANATGYKHYGGRGIKVCDRWLHSFENFISDMGEKPSPSHSIDRIDVNGNYEPSNCRWATRDEQLNNQRKPRIEGWGSITLPDGLRNFPVLLKRVYGKSLIYVDNKEIANAIFTLTRRKTISENDIVNLRGIGIEVTEKK